jgi:hypothetical protein
MSSSIISFVMSVYFIQEKESEWLCKGKHDVYWGKKVTSVCEGGILVATTLSFPFKKKSQKDPPLARFFLTFCIDKFCIPRNPGDGRDPRLGPDK